MTYERLGLSLGRVGVQAQRYCKAQTDRRHSQPGPEVGSSLKALTHNVIDLGNYADELTAAEAAEMMAEIARREAAKAGEVARG